MSAWAALAGGASGVMGAWDDNREAIKAQAAQDFKLQLERERVKLVENSAERQAGVMLDPESKQGMLAQRNASATAESERLKRDNDLAIAQAKGAGRQYLDANTQALFDHHSKVITQDSTDNEELKRDQEASREWIRLFQGGKEDTTGADILAAMAADKAAKSEDAGGNAAIDAERAKRAEADRLANQPAPSWGQEFSSNKPGIIDKARDMLEGYNSGQEQTLIKTVFAAADKIEAALKEGRPVDPRQVRLLSNAQGIKGIDPKELPRMKKLYLKARGQ